ncbi:MAG TPA: DNA polymerase III subunit delta' [Candidatus Bathyarchaeia archaeon]|nr:DNA polymerase III subunit delta' [Candidatus Bathyarchaeia archaeon]
MIFEDVVGLARPREVLGKILASGRVPHALLFHGPEGVGKRTLALRFAASLLCDTPRETTHEACGSCVSCRKADHGNHPDLLVIGRLPKDAAADDEEPGEGDLRAVITVGQIREMSEHAAYAPREGPRRVFVVDSADRMKLEAQNALLKTLEEPPGRAVILLVASRPHALLATVRSRCFQVGFAAMAPAALAEALERRGVAPEEARRRAALSDGRPGRALTVDVQATGERRDAVLGTMIRLAASPRGALSLGDDAAALAGESEDELVEGIELVASLARDAARLASGHSEVLHADAGPRLGELARVLDAGAAAEIVALASRLRADLRINANRTLVAETLLAAVAGAIPAA